MMENFYLDLSFDHSLGGPFKAAFERLPWPDRELILGFKLL